MKARDLDKKFDNKENIIPHLDVSKARRPILEQRRVNIDIPIWMIESLDKESKRLGVTRQSVIKMWLAERLEQRAV
ncbi:MAG: CopG family transcriptional regulator [Candidatus Margulisbacteria bacterium]|nr:CopG family transcriptional regulator [Candidatus Margulisiibacteriota bacterium]